MHTTPFTQTRRPYNFAQLRLLTLCALVSWSLSIPAAAESALKAFSDSVIVKSYADLDVKAAELLSAVNSLAEETTSESVEAARDAWRAARIPWEHSEAFLFGPVDTEGHDPELDSWPVNITDLLKVIDDTTGPASIHAASVSKLDEGQKGFHVIEFLLFSDGSGEPSNADKTAAALKSATRKLDYLKAATEVFKSRTSALLADYRGDTAFAAQFAKAGQSGSPYSTVAAAYEEIVNGMTGIADESANVKLLEPAQEKNPELLESRFSGHTLNDVLLNIDGIAMSYEAAIQPRLAESNPQLETRVRTALAEYRTAVQALPAPLRDNLETAASAIGGAASKGNALRDLLAEEVLPVVQGWLPEPVE